MAFNIRGQQVSKHLIENLIQQYPKVQVQKLDWKRYLEDNPDLQEGNITNQLDACNHAIHHGIYNGGRKVFDVNGKVFKYTFKHKIYESEISKKIPSEEAAYLDYCNSDTTCLHPYLKIKEPYVKYKSKISETFEEIEKIIVNYYSIDDLLINNNELDILIDLLDVLNECREEDQELKEEEKRLLEAAIYLEAQNDIKKAEKRRKTEKERHDLLKKRDEQAKAMAEKLKKEQEEKLKKQRLEKEAEIKRKELEKIQKQQEEQKIKAAQSKIVEEMLNVQRKKRALDKRIRLEVSEKKKFFEEDKMNTLIMDVLNQKEVDFKGKKVLINTHTMLSVAAGDTIMIGNIVNLFLNTNSHVVILTKYNVGDVFLNNLISDNYTIVQKEDDKEIMDFIDENHTDFACLFFRNHEILQALKGKFYLYKTVLYGLEIHIEDISKLNNNFLYTLTQSEELKNMYIEKGISKDKIKILDVITVKYDFELPERKDNEIRLIYSGTLRDEENILEIIEEFQKIHSERPEVVLKIVYGKIVDNGKGFKAKLEKIIENGVKGIIFKYGLSHKDACYQIATSDIGLCWRKDGWGDDGQISTKLKEYEMYGLQIINNMKLKVGVVTSTNKLNKIDNIIRNFKQQLYFNKKLFLVLNNNDIYVNYIQKQMTEHNILYEIINFDEKFNLGHCLNEAIKKLKEQNYDIFAKFDDDDIYEKYYILEQTYNLSKYHNCIVGKYNVPLFIPEYNNFYTIDNFTKKNEFAEICRGSTIMFNVNNIKYSFNTEESQGVDTLFLKKHINSGGKIYVTSFNNYIWIRHLDNKKHTWKLCTNDLFLKQITDANLIYKLYSSLLEYKFIDVSHLLVTAIITMYNSSKTIEKCLLSMLDQSHKNIEIIVVDDESTDDSVERVTSFIEVHKNIKLIKNTENRGTYYCKNMALKNMSKHTKYIAFQDSDDFSHKERIRKQIEVLHMTNGKLSVSLCERYNNLRFACVSQVYDIEIFNKLGYFDNSRFGADSEYLYRFFKLNNIELNGNYNYNKGTIFENNLSIHYCIPYKLYIINNNDDTCLSNINPLNSKKRIEYKNKYINKINNLNNLYYDFTI